MDSTLRLLLLSGWMADAFRGSDGTTKELPTELDAGWIDRDDLTIRAHGSSTEGTSSFLGNRIDSGRTK